MTSVAEKIELGAEASLAVAGALIATADLISYFLGDGIEVKIEDLPSLIESEEMQLAISEVRRRKASEPFLNKEV